MPIVEAVGVSAGIHDHTGLSRGALIEGAMRQAVIEAQAAGITDPDVIRERMLAARQTIIA